MIATLSLEEAQEWFQKLPRYRRIATLAPDYVVADSTRDSSLAPLFVGYNEGDSFWLHGVHRGSVEQIHCWDFQSPYGYGGPVTNCDDQAFLWRAWAKYTQWCRENGVLVEFVRLHPLAVDWQFYGGKIHQDRNTVMVPLQNIDIRGRYEIRCRTAVRKAEKAGLFVEKRPSSEICSRFADFYRQEMINLGAEPFYLFSDTYFSALSQLRMANLFVCRQEDDWLSAGIFFKEETTLEYHLSATSQAGRKLAATNLLLDVTASWGQYNGLEYLYLGGGTNGDAENPLFFFKCGFSPVRLPYRFGFCIHQPEAYNAFRDAHKNFGGVNSHILFYR